VTPPLVSIRDVRKSYRSRRDEPPALDGISLDIAPGEFVVLLGPSGCGKTTLLRCIAGLERPDEGEITIAGETVFSASRGIALPPEDRRLSMVFQSYALWPHMTAFENVAYPLRNTRADRGEIQDRVREALRMVALESVRGDYPGQLSGGQQQRVALARAMVSNSGLVLFDEPLSNLDAKVRERLRVDLLGLQRRYGFSAVYVTHDQTEALALADRVVVMNIGRIAQIGTPGDVYLEPESRYVADFVGSANELSGTVLGWDGAFCRVRTEIGDLLGTATSAVTARGQSVSLLFRPEHCRLGAARSDAPDKNMTANSMTARLERSLFLGPLVEHLVAIDRTRLVLHSADGEILPGGSEIVFSIRPERARIFATEPT
jgi:iron(III) transport system ATP-binding protein